MARVFFGGRAGGRRNLGDTRMAAEEARPLDEIAHIEFRWPDVMVVARERGWMIDRAVVRGKATRRAITGLGTPATWLRARIALGHRRQPHMLSVSSDANNGWGGQARGDGVKAATPNHDHASVGVRNKRLPARAWRGSPHRSRHKQQSADPAHRASARASMRGRWRLRLRESVKGDISSAPTNARMRARKRAMNYNNGCVL